VSELPLLLAERTSLAWERTGLGVVGVAALLAHVGFTAAWAVTLVLGIGLLVLASVRLRRITAGIARHEVAPARGPVLGLTLVLLVVAALAAATVLRG
jgi:putative membrane protein